MVMTEERVDLLDVFAGVPDKRVKRKVGHRFDDIHYEPGNGPSWAVCTCGQRLEAASPDDLGRAWVAHGGLSSKWRGPS